MAVKIAAWIVAVWVASNSAISALILYKSLIIFYSAFVCLVETIYS